MFRRPARGGELGWNASSRPSTFCREAGHLSGLTPPAPHRQRGLLAFGRRPAKVREPGTAAGAPRAAAAAVEQCQLHQTQRRPRPPCGQPEEWSRCGPGARSGKAAGEALAAACSPTIRARAPSDPLGRRLVHIGRPRTGTLGPIAPLRPASDKIAWQEGGYPGLRKEVERLAREAPMPEARPTRHALLAGPMLLSTADLRSVASFGPSPPQASTLKVGPIDLKSAAGYQSDASSHRRVN